MKLMAWLKRLKDNISHQESMTSSPSGTLTLMESLYSHENIVDDFTRGRETEFPSRMRT
jgi:hypothetical protein